MRAPRPVRDSWSKVAISLATLLFVLTKGRISLQKDTNVNGIPSSGCCYLFGEQLSLPDKVADITTMVCEMLSAV
jgi:hypothetical protein